MVVNKVGLFYGSSTGNCELAARKIQQLAEPAIIELHDIFYTPGCTLEKYTKVIFGISTWGVGDMQDDWEEFVRYLQKHSFANKTVALYGYGDQQIYPDSYVDAMGRLHELLSHQKANFVGHWPTEGYRFRQSKAHQDGYFVGLALDDDNQPELTDQRISKWVDSLNGFLK